MLLPAVPPRVSPDLAGVNTELYILKQTHEPLFRKDDGQSFQSRILTKWSRTVDSTSFTFCPNTSLVFDPQRAFSAKVLRGHLDVVTRRFDATYTLAEDGGCITVGFRQGRKHYLDFLSLYENAPSMRTDVPNVEVGLGPFQVQSLAPEKIVLVRKKRVSEGYNEVVLHFYRGPGDPNLGNKRIVDFNRIPTADLPAWVAADYQSFSNTLLKSFNLIINHPDRSVRAAVYGCMDVDRLRRAYFPSQVEFHDIKSILPVGVPGALAGKPAQSCAMPKRPQGERRPLVFVNWRTDNDRQLQEFVEDFTRRTGIPVEIKKITLSALVDVVFKRPHPYQLMVIALDAVRPDHSAFLDYIIKKDGLIDFDLPQAKVLYGRMEREDDAAKRTALVSGITSDISREAAVLPLFQDVRRFYYPKEIRNFVIGKGFLEYPEIGELRL
ncbi:MAG: hypothetical protein A2V88_01460 [Elusimicrobia bacterium RBG_16_66_12]|nr:MAG: hypothetical protein A2V88_01460 [Elusimicrobia bacterium RBG_16_66_12]